MDNVYECMFLLDSNKYARDPGGVSGELDKIVQNCDGQVLVSRLWNEQKLAYPIDGHKKGTYWLSYFRMESGRQTEFNRMCRLNENIMRQLLLKVDPRIAETLIVHAGGAASSESADGGAAGSEVAGETSSESGAETAATDA